MNKLSNSYLGDAYLKMKLEYVRGAAGAASYHRISDIIKGIKPKFSLYDSFSKYSHLRNFKSNTLGQVILQDLESILSEETEIEIKIPNKKKKQKTATQKDVPRFFVMLGHAMRKARD